MKSPRILGVVVTLVLVTRVWAQVGGNPGSTGDQMLMPAPISGQALNAEATSEERTNYLRAGVALMGSYTDDTFENENGHSESDTFYTVSPTLNWQETTSRLQWLLGYAPGYTFYQHENSLNQATQNATLGLQYRLSPHTQLGIQDRLQKSSNIFNQPDPTSTAIVSGGTQVPNLSVIAPTADQLTNVGTVSFSYQFALNAMFGASGTFSNLHYPSPNAVSGLSDSESQGGRVFISLRASNVHYFGATYQYERLLSFPFGVSDQTRTQAAMLFYSFSPTKKFSLSVFGGPQYSDTAPTAFPLQPPTPEIQAWTPAVGGSVSVSGELTGFALSYSHIISGGGGLAGAVHMDNAAASVHRRISETFSATLVGGYTNNAILAGSTPFMNNGHTIQGTASLQKQVGHALSFTVGYSRLSEVYSNVSALGLFPNSNREFVTVSYQFSRPIGR